MSMRLQTAVQIALFGFFILINLSVIAVSQQLHSDDVIIEWPLVSNSNDNYVDNLTKIIWPAYTKVVEKGTSSEFIKVLSDGELEFKWKSDEKVGFIRHISFYKNGLLYSELVPESQEGWNTFKVGKVSLNDILLVKFNFGMGGSRVWFAFPPATASQLAQTVQTPRANASVPQANVTSPLVKITDLEKAITTRIDVKKTDDLQKLINESKDYTELALIDNKYNLGNGLIIQGKKHLIIYSKIENSSERALVNFLNKEMIKIYDSDHVKLFNLNLSSNECNIGIDIKESNYLEIIDNEITFSCCGYGIVLESGSYNIINGNKLCNRSNECIGNAMSCGVAVIGATNTYIKNNNINCDNKSGILHYHIMNSQPLNTTIIVPDFREEYELRVGECSCMWRGGYFSECYEEGRPDERGYPNECSSHEDNRPEANVWNF